MLLRGTLQEIQCVATTTTAVAAACAATARTDLPLRVISAVVGTSCRHCLQTISILTFSIVRDDDGELVIGLQ